MSSNRVPAIFVSALPSETPDRYIAHQGMRNAERIGEFLAKQGFRDMCYYCGTTTDGLMTSLGIMHGVGIAHAGAVRVCQELCDWRVGEGMYQLTDHRWDELVAFAKERGVDPREAVLSPDFNHGLLQTFWEISAQTAEFVRQSVGNRPGVPNLFVSYTGARLEWAFMRLLGLRNVQELGFRFIPGEVAVLDFIIPDYMSGNAFNGQYYDEMLRGLVPALRCLGNALS